jgi:hypothetical protein
MDTKYYQQGDVLLFNDSELPKGLTKLETHVVQEGEHTGHAHRLFEGDYELYENSETKEKFLKVLTPVALRHEEHKQIDLPPDVYRIGIIKEYDHFEEVVRNVLD